MYAGLCRFYQRGKRECGDEASAIASCDTFRLSEGLEIGEEAISRKLLIP